MKKLTFWASAFWFDLLRGRARKRRERGIEIKAWIYGHSRPATITLRNSPPLASAKTFYEMKIMPISLERWEFG